MPSYHECVRTVENSVKSTAIRRHDIIIMELADQQEYRADRGDDKAIRLKLLPSAIQDPGMQVCLKCREV